MNGLTPEQEAIVKQTQDNLDTALKNLHNAVKSSGLSVTQAYMNAMCRLDEYSFWIGQCQIELPGVDLPLEEATVETGTVAEAEQTEAE